MEKSKIVAAILAFFLGVIGVDRFYLGYTGMGVLKLLTGGGFGILWLVDFVRILTGSLKPRNGEYAANSNF
jgi:TM2 domain-containing membrane protein YozV